MVYLCRWPDGTISVTSPTHQDDLFALFDQLGDPTDGALVRPLGHLALDFEIDEEGDVRLRALGAAMARELLEVGYPAVLAALTQGRGSAEVALAVAVERQRLWNESEDLDDEEDLDEGYEEEEPDNLVSVGKRGGAPKLCVYLYRWPDGRTSVIGATNRKEVETLLREFGVPGKPGYLRPLAAPLLVALTLTDHGAFVLTEATGLGEETCIALLEEAYPILNAAPYDDEVLRQAAVRQERERLTVVFASNNPFE